MLGGGDPQANQTRFLYSGCVITRELSISDFALIILLNYILLVSTRYIKYIILVMQAATDARNLLRKFIMHFFSATRAPHQTITDHNYAHNSLR